MKNIFSSILFCLIFLLLFVNVNEILLEKGSNRYYMLSKELEELEDIEVQVYGSCHAYTSFDALLFSENCNVSSYNMANPGEIIPSTYLRMYERFKKDVPEVVLVELWGVNAYETYETTENIMDVYFRYNIEDIPFSLEKLKVINDFESLDMLEENFAVAKYKDRLVNFSIQKHDFNYSFDYLYNLYSEKNGVYVEMYKRLSNRGFLPYDNYSCDQYADLQANVEESDMIAVEADIMKYIEKIIALCNKNDVKVIFYRAPYISTENELRKVNYLKSYFQNQEVEFYDLESEIEWDYELDFADYYHLSKYGAKKSTEFLTEKIMQNLVE